MTVPHNANMAQFLLDTADSADAYVAAIIADGLMAQFLRANAALWRVIAAEMVEKPWRKDSPVWAAAVTAAAAWPRGSG